MPTVLILQEYVPRYRVPFFERLIENGRKAGITIRVAAGAPSGAQSKRADQAQTDFIEYLPQKELGIGGYRFVLRPLKHFFEDLDLLILEQARRNIDVYALFLPKYLRRYPMALWGHGRDYVSNPSPLSSALMRALTNRADWFFAYTEGGCSTIVTSGYPSNRATVVKNAVETEPFIGGRCKSMDKRVAEFRLKHNLTSKTAVFIGGLDQSKRPDFLVEAAKKAHRIDSEFRLLIVGDGIARPKIEEAAGEHHWMTFTGPLFGVEKAVAIAAGSVLAMPGRVGLLAVESLASGRPIVTTDWPWHAPEFEYLHPSRTCIVSDDNTDDYAKELIKILSDEQALERMKNRCIESAASYSIDEMVSRYLEGIAGALKAGRRR